MFKRNVVRVFLLLSFMIFQIANASAQVSGNSEKFWSEEPATCLLFNVQNLTASAYNGGIGLGFITSPTQMWRLSVSVDVEYQEREESVYPGGTQNSIRISLGASPIWKLKSWNDLYMFMGPSIGLRASYNRSNSTAFTEYSAGVGGSIGIGYIFHKQISLTAEYGVSAGVSVNSYEKRLSAGTHHGGMTLFVKL
jgi:hypothetical protein